MFLYLVCIRDVQFWDIKVYDMEIDALILGVVVIIVAIFDIAEVDHLHFLVVIEEVCSFFLQVKHAEPQEAWVAA